LSKELETQKLKKSIDSILERYTLKTMRTDTDIEPTSLYLVDEEAMNELLVLQNSFNNEILKYKKINQDEERYLSKYGFQKSCKLLNPSLVSYKYLINIFNNWKQVNDKRKVYDRLDAEFEIWKNVYLKHSTEELEKNEDLDAEFVAHQKKEILSAIKSAKEKHEWIKKNFYNPEINLEVRISSRDRSKKYATIYYYYNIDNEETPKMHRKKLHLDIHRPNVLWYQPKEDTSLETFMKNATNAYGDVYFIES